MKILLIEPYYTGSHKQWADGFQRSSQHEIRILSMKGQFWKWRMHGGAITLAKEFNENDWCPDLILATDMLDLTTFLSLTRERSHNIPTAIYFHENQLSYPWSPDDRDIKNKRDTHYGFINYSSALSADKVLFNSEFHMRSFLNELQPFLKQFPDHQELGSIDNIYNKSKVLYLGMELQCFDKHKIDNPNERPLILWNHRWEYDKNPELFFSVLEKLKDSGIDFSLAVLGENFNRSPSIFDQAKEDFKNNIIQWGYTESFNEYAEWLWKADILPVTSNQEFFGASVMEAIYCQVWPILPCRLTYPELISSNDNEDNFYKNEDELYSKIIRAVDNTKRDNKSNLKSIAKQFDWKYMGPIYDKLLARI